MTASEVFSKAKWIWTKGKTKSPVHVSCFRHSFTLSGKPQRASLACCADSKYQLWINGRYQGTGPARGVPDHPYYDTYNILPCLKKGKNTICFLVQHYTDGASIFCAVEGGLICQLNGDRDEVIAATGGKWRAMSSDSYQSLPGLIFAGSFDATREPSGWIQADFDDALWNFSRQIGKTKLAPPQNLIPRPIPLLTEKRCNPERILDAGLCQDKECKNIKEEKHIAQSLSRSVLESFGDKGLSHLIKAHALWTGRAFTIHPPSKDKSVYLSLDFSRIILATPQFEMKGPAGTIVDIGYSEILNDNRVEPFLQRLELHDRIILGKGVTKIRLIQPRGFRFMMLRFSDFKKLIRIKDICAMENIYPAQEKGKFQCSDPLLGRIYHLASRGVNLCMEDSYTDCPWRERCQWLGDFQPEALFSYYLFGSYDISRKAVIEYARSNTQEGWIPGVFPVTKPFNLPTWGMRYPVIAWEYFLFTGDREIFKLAYPAVKKQMEWLARYENKDGILENTPGWCFVDWTKTDADKGDGAIQGWYLEAIEHTALLAGAAGDRRGAKLYEKRGRKLRKSLAEYYWSPEQKAFLKYSPRLSRRPAFAPPDLIGQHENFLFSLLKIGTPAMRRKALEAVKGATEKFLPNLGNYQSAFTTLQTGNVSSEKILLIGTPFWSYYALLSLLDAGRDMAALEYIRLCWGLMLENGATACWEMWDRNTSQCHGWSAAPAMILPAYVLGVYPIKPGFSEFAVQPRLFDLSWAKGAVPTPRGNIAVSWRIQKNKRLVIKITAPRNTTGYFIIPRECKRKGSRRIRLNPGTTDLAYDMIPDK